MILISCNNCNHNYQTPQGLITSDIANSYEEAYKSNQYEAINAFLSNDGVERTDNRDIWFSMEEMENYIHYVKQKSDSLGLEKLGLRVYFGSKPDSHGITKSTVFFAPTHKVITRGHAPNINSNGISPLNYGNAGMPPNDYNSGD